MENKRVFGATTSGYFGPPVIPHATVMQNSINQWQLSGGYNMI